MNRVTTSKLFTYWLPLPLVIAVIVHYFWFLNAHAINVPFHDDIIDFLKTILALDSPQSGAQAISLLFEQYNDHRTMASRLLVYLAFLVQGEVNFRALTLLANLALAFILALYYIRLRLEALRWLWLLTAALLLLNIRAYTIPLFSQAAFAYYWVLFYSFSAVFLLHNATPSRFALAAVACTLASFTLASGQVAWALGLASLLHQRVIRRSCSSGYIYVWIVAAMAALTIWHMGFIPMDFSAERHEFYLPIFPDNILNAPWHTIASRFVLFFLATLGSGVTDTHLYVAIGTGLTLLTVLAAASINGLRHADIRLELCCWFVVGFAAAVAYGRSKLLIPSYALQDRYSFLSAVLLSGTTLLLLTRTTRWRIALAWSAALLAAGYCSWTFAHFSPALAQLMQLRMEQFNARQYPVATQRAATEWVDEAVTRNIYVPPCRPLPQCNRSAAGD